MPKRRPSIDPSQLGFTFDPPAPARMPAALAGLDRMIAAAVALALKDDSRSREVIAAEMSELLGEDVSRMMLDGYASEARDKVNISAARALALVAVTERFDLLDAMTRRIGASIIVGEEIIDAEIGQIEHQIARLAERKKKLRRSRVVALGQIQPERNR